MLMLVVALAQGPQYVELQPGMVITQSTRVTRRTYALSGPPITIRGSNITVDFNGATLEGTPLKSTVMLLPRIVIGGPLNA